MIQEIFEKVISDSAYMNHTSTTVETEVTKVMEKLDEESSELRKEELRDCLYGIAFVAEKSAFEVGFRYAMTLLINSVR